jgi:hypothetical protein
MEMVEDRIKKGLGGDVGDEKRMIYGHVYR